MLGLSVGYFYLILYILAVYMNTGETTTTSKIICELLGPVTHSKHTDPKVLSMLEEIFGKEDKEAVNRSKTPITSSENIVDISTPKFPKSSSPMKGGNLPLVDFKGSGKKTKSIIDERNEMSHCLRLVRQAQAKLKYLWDKIYHGKSSAGSEIQVFGVEKAASPGNSNNLEVPLTLQIGTPTVKS
nr:uncharacterized protein LOC106689395 [Halyomorpha halys]